MEILFDNLVWDLKQRKIEKQENNGKVALDERDKKRMEDLIGLEEITIEYPKVGEKVEFKKYKYLGVKDWRNEDIFELIRQYYDDEKHRGELNYYQWFDCLEKKKNVYRLQVRNTELRLDNIPEFYKWQIDHFINISKILNEWHVYLDCSPVGTGKTFVNCAVAREFGLKLIVVAPKSLLSKWEMVAKMFELNILEILSYNDITSVRGYQPKTEYLTRIDNEQGTKYETTIEFEEVVSEGVLLLFDEIHKLKNNTLKTQASCALIRSIIKINSEQPSISRVGLLGATPGNEEIHADSILKLMGLTTQEKLFEYHRRKKYYDLLGLEDIRNWGLSVNPELTRQIFNRPYNKETLPTLMFEFATQVAAPAIGSAMPSLPPAECYNGFFQITDEKNRSLLKNGTILLRRVAKHQNEPDEEDSNTHKNNISNVVKALEKCETAKIDDLIRIAKEDLVQNPNVKVILFLNYYKNKSIEKIVNALKEFNPVEYTGRIKSTLQRIKNLDKFQQSNSNCRVLIGTVAVAAEGIDLDDKHGDFPRIMYIMPSYNTLELYQSVGRINRSDSKSIGRVYFFYGAVDGKIERNLLDSILRKSQIAKKYILTQSIPPFPSEYNDYVEAL